MQDISLLMGGRSKVNGQKNKSPQDFPCTNDYPTIPDQNPGHLMLQCNFSLPMAFRYRLVESEMM